VPLDGGISLEWRCQIAVSAMKSRYFTAIDLSGMKTVADRHRFTAYHKSTANNFF